MRRGDGKDFSDVIRKGSTDQVFGDQECRGRGGIIFTPTIPFCTRFSSAVAGEGGRAAGLQGKR
jgi:hypothetical protein